MALLFALGTAAIVGAFVFEIVHKHQVRTGLLMYGMFTGAAAYGLWRLRAWGRTMALVVALGNAGLGSLVLLSALVSHQGSKLVAGILLVTNVALGYVLGLPVFSFHEDGA
jgi:uncharacterized membrane protein (DUF2068 family)